MPEDQPTTQTPPVRVQPDGSTILFRSAGSGLWYENPDAAGDVDCISFHGKLYRHPGIANAELYRLCVARCPDFEKLTFDDQTKVRDAVLRDL